MAGVTRLSASALSSRVIPASIAGACVAFLVFTLLNRERRNEGLTEGEAIPPAFYPDDADSAAPFRLNLVKALLPLLPITLLLLASSGWTPLQWLRSVPPGPKWEPFAGALPVVRAMLIGALLMLAVNWREVSQVARSLFDGMGRAYGSIISLTITAQCFGAGLAVLGVTDMLVQLLSGKVALARLLTVGFPWGLAVLSGSGSGPILTFAQTFLAPLGDRYDPITLGSLACLAGAFGRTMSPIAAVVVYSSGLVGVSPVLLVRRLLPALLAGAAVALLVALARG
jgi:DcuC family C4-dicarboxylate transporter